MLKAPSELREVYKNIPDYVDGKLQIGKVSPRTKITSLDQLKKGDHIMEESPLGYWHHFIVEKVCDDYAWRIHKTGDPQTGKYSLSILDLTAKAEVSRDKFTLEPGMVVYRVEYDQNDGGGVFSGDQAVRRARKRIGERNYNAFTSNCEHFCTECKTGKCISYQVYDILWSIFRLIFLIFNFVFWGAFIAIGTSTGFVASTTILILSHAFALVLGFLQDAFSIAFFVFRAHKAKSQGHVTAQDAERFKAKRVTQVVFGFVGYIAGAALGFYHVPVPYIGSFVGGFFGSFVWQLLGLMLGRWIATIL
ncbi:uncharacterized protein LOC116307855 [Actinia tenebrosa]|uniref:Uncharacterized protein LOC116307855 n=1 Tax=Actinia tenebrosa TaxID=6105 RepID=A0A6P8JBF4_ACTTE|nr:uncharacterized protein LOC116307855 [Actinia tenebrosa]